MEWQAKYNRANTTIYRTTQHNNKGILQNCLIVENERRSINNKLKQNNTDFI